MESLKPQKSLHCHHYYSYCPFKAAGALLVRNRYAEMALKEAAFAILIMVGKRFLDAFTTSPSPMAPTSSPSFSSPPVTQGNFSSSSSFFIWYSLCVPNWAIAQINEVESQIRRPSSVEVNGMEAVCWKVGSRRTDLVWSQPNPQHTGSARPLRVQ